MAASIVGHLSVGACGGRQRRVDLGPGRAVESPGVIQVTRVAESSEQNDFLARRVVGHRRIGPSWRGDCRAQFRPSTRKGNRGLSTRESKYRQEQTDAEETVGFQRKRQCIDP